MDAIPGWGRSSAASFRASPRRYGQRKTRTRRWWLPGAGLALAVAALYTLAATSTIAPVPSRGAAWWLVTVALHAPLLLIFCFLASGLVERLGFYARGRAAAVPGRIPAEFPTVCVQLPMFNEH